MNKNRNTVLGIIGGILILCALVGAAGFFALRSLSGPIGEGIESLVLEEPAEIRKETQDMVRYVLPRGYEEEGLFNFFVYRILFISPEGAFSSGSRPLIMIAEFSSGFSLENEAQSRQFQESFERQMRTSDLQLTLAERREVTIRDQVVGLNLYTGTDESGAAFRQITSDPFEGQSGTLFFMISGPEAGWDQAEIDRFIASIR